MSIVYRSNPEPFNDLANTLKAIAHPQRLCIVKTLCEKGESNVTEMQHCLSEAQATVSQHLSKLKAAGIIVGNRNGTNVYYSIRNDKVEHLIKSIVQNLDI